MADLLSRDADPTGIMSLLTPFVSGGAISPDTDPQVAATAAAPAWLAFARTMGQAAQPRYGPAPPIGPALADAMSAGYGTALQAEQLPLLRQSAGLSLAQREMALQQQQFEFGREQATWNAFRGMLTPGAPATQGAAPGAPASGFGAPATTQALAELPDIQAIADPVMRFRVIQTAADQGMSAPAAAQWARQLQVESGGVQFDPNGAVITSPKGARGVGQVMPATFTAMQKAHPDISGDIDDPGSNLKASAYYFNQGLSLANGSLPGAAVYYNAGPDGLTSYLKTGQPPAAETADYLVKTGALPASGGAGAPSALGPMVQTPLGSVPQQVLEQAQFAGLSAAPGQELGAYRDVIQKWQQAQVVPGASGQQIKTFSGEASPAPVVPSVEPLEGAERERLAPGYPPDISLMKITGPTGAITVQPVGGARGANLPFARINDQNNAVLGSDAYKNWQAGNQRAEATFVGLNQNSRVGDEAAILSAAKVFDPNAAVTEGRIEMASQFGGFAQKWGDWLSRLQKGQVSELPADVRQNLADIVTDEMKTRDSQVADLIGQTRTNYDASAPGGDSGRIMPGWQPRWLTADDPAMLPQGMRPAAPVVATTGADGVMRWRRGLATEARAAPAPAATPATATPATAATPPPAAPAAQPAAQPRQPVAQQPQQPKGSTAPGPAPGQVTPEALGKLTAPELRAFAASIPPDSTYSDQELGMIAAALRGRKQ